MVPAPGEPPLPPPGGAVVGVAVVLPGGDDPPQPPADAVPAACGAAVVVVADAEHCNPTPATAKEGAGVAVVGNVTVDCKVDGAAAWASAPPGVVLLRPKPAEACDDSSYSGMSHIC